MIYNNHKENTHSKASATVGSEGLQAVIRQAIELYAARTIVPFVTRQEALEWLASQ